MRAVYFDTETGGLHDDAPIIQIAAVAVEESSDGSPWKEIESFERKLKFAEDDADPEALAINHYDATVWREQAIPVQSALTSFASFMKPHCALRMVSKRTGNPYWVAKLVGHNAATFDGPRVKQLYTNYGIFFPADPRIRCTVQQAMFWFDSHDLRCGVAPGPKSFKLGDLCAWFGLPVADDAHDALADVRMTIALAQRLRDPALPMGVSRVH
jgi:DNA polymerase III epsilon subunit-like protein